MPTSATRKATVVPDASQQIPGKVVSWFLFSFNFFSLENNNEIDFFFIQQKKKKTRDRKRDKDKETAASLMVACLKRLLPVGLNLFAGREQELVQHCKDRFLKVNVNGLFLHVLILDASKLIILLLARGRIRNRRFRQNPTDASRQDRSVGRHVLAASFVFQTGRQKTGRRSGGRRNRCRTQNRQPAATAAWRTCRADSGHGESIVWPTHGK